MARALREAVCKWGLMSPAWPSHGRPDRVWALPHVYHSPPRTSSFTLYHLRSPLGESCFHQCSVGGLSRTWTVLKAILVLFDIASLCWALNIVHPAHCSTAQFNLLFVTLWCHRTTWTRLWGLWRWTCHQVCGEFIVLAGVNISSACGMLSTGSVQLG